MSDINTALRQKILELFHYRALPYLINSVEHDSSAVDDLISKLIRVQSSIYALDEVLESEWEIIASSLKGKWDDIIESLIAANVDPVQVHDYCKHIFKYQKHELQQREGKSLLRLSMEYFYFYKSCDVKLLRRIILDHYPRLRSLYPESDWRWFDLVTEINDDVTDVFDDIGTNNGNRFLLQIRDIGIEDTYDAYKNFLEEIGDAFRSRIDQRKVHSLIIDLTFKELSQTLNLLEDRKNNIALSGLPQELPGHS